MSFPFLQLHVLPVVPSLQPLEVLLNASTDFYFIEHSSFVQCSDLHTILSYTELMKLLNNMRPFEYISSYWPVAGLAGTD